MLSPCWHHVGTIFRSWALLGRMLHVLLRFFSFLVGFCASWGALGSILEGFGTLWGGFWSSQSIFFEGFFVHVRLQCEKPPNV